MTALSIPKRALLGMTIAGALATLSTAPALDLTIRPLLSEQKTDRDFGGGRKIAEACSVSPIRDLKHDPRYKAAACGES